jgi:hypothetical protein
MKIRFLRRWRGCRINDVYEWSDGAARILIERGIAREVKRGRPPKVAAMKMKRQENDDVR